ncbi:MAG: hypothetical protein JW966_02110 [Anaerolineae bacterium]|nr:hypothetical protein [Anaerolineae bacterium]
MWRWVCAVFMLVLMIVFVMALGACGSDETDNNDEPAEQSTESAPLPGDDAPATLSPVLMTLQRRYEAIQAAYAAISDVWESLAAGEQAQCGDYPVVPDPASILSQDDPAYGDLADLLRRAAIDTGEAVNLWRAECVNPRTNPSPDVINAGLLAARAAGDALAQAQALLSDIQ